MILLVLGAPGAIRLLVNPGDAGLLSWLPGGYGVQLTPYVVGLVIGIVLLVQDPTVAETHQTPPGALPADRRDPKLDVGAAD